MFASSTFLKPFLLITNWCACYNGSKSFSSASLGANSLHTKSNSFRSKKAGFGGTCMPLTAARGGTLFLDKYLWMIFTPIQHCQHFFY